ncbi:MAG: isopentenyl transferase family protein [Patescibacteria group bacterium]
MEMTNSKRKIVAVVGPTGSGKTAMALALAKEFNGVIISADSRQVYRGLNIGTNKEPVPQELIDIAEPGERFTLHDWLERAKYTLERIFESSKVPVVVGGTGLYVTALLEGYQPGSGRFSKKRRPVPFQSLAIMPQVERSELYRRSDERYERIFDDLIAETKQLIDSGVDPDWLVNIGLDYRYATLFITGRRNRELAISEFQQASRAYIRRQLTWWRHHGVVAEVATEQEAKEVVGQFLR